MKQNQCVDVISVCNSQGDIMPLRLQLLDDAQQLVRVHIRQAKREQEITHVGAEAVIFRCWARVHERDLHFRLKYTFRSHVWQIL